MKRLLHIIVLLLTLSVGVTTSTSTWARTKQEMPKRNEPSKFAIKKVDFDHVKKVTEDPSNAYYFPKLMRAYNSNDTSLSIEAWRNFYYGYTFQEDYNPFRESI